MGNVIEVVESHGGVGRSVYSTADAVDIVLERDELPTRAVPGVACARSKGEPTVVAFRVAVLGDEHLDAARGGVGDDDRHLASMGVSEILRCKSTLGEHGEKRYLGDNNLSNVQRMR